MAKDAPAGVKLWQATNPEARDFRLETFGPHWVGSQLEPESPGVFVARVEKPARGWTAFFVELTFPTGPQLPPLKFTTQVRVVPDVLPFKFVPKGRPQ